MPDAPLDFDPYASAFHGDHSTNVRGFAATPIAFTPGKGG